MDDRASLKYGTKFSRISHVFPRILEKYKNFEETICDSGFLDVCENSRSGERELLSQASFLGAI